MIKAAQAEGPTHWGRMKSKNFSSICTGITRVFDINAVHNTFYQSFTTEVAVSEAALALPEMGGAGWVRDLREAMSLGTAQADALVAEVRHFAAGTTKAEQIAQLDEIIRAWAASNGYVAVESHFKTWEVTTYNLFAEQVQPMLNAYEQLRQSVYGALVMQTQLKPYLDSIELENAFALNPIASNDCEWRTCP